ncbi:MAG: class I SAM-dependent methyltransferase [Nocardioidaceae bacterium]|nr:class I SAM-dependent methyltransferase [Nocardioidaceae bacterium]
MTAVAPALASALRPVVGELPVRLRAWDGSEAGAGPVVTVHSKRALRRMLWSPGELGAAQAYVTGELEVEGDLDDALSHVRSVVSSREVRLRVLPLLGTALRLGVVGRRPAPPASQATMTGRLHSRRRDRAAISHHYDLSNAFYAAILDESMAYSCGYWTGARTLADAQASKAGLVCEKLDLRPGDRLLDVGCGWGSLSLYAASEFGARVTGLTLSAEQKRYVDARDHDGVEVLLRDYRDVTGTFDAVASIEMGEHVGAARYPSYVETLRRSVKPGGRVLVQQMSRSGSHPGGGPFIESFIAPDMTMRPVEETVGLIAAGGLRILDVQPMREHYVRTVEAWIERFEESLPVLRTLVPEEVVRVWRLYLVGGRMAFRDGRMGVDQILAERPWTS